MKNILYLLTLALLGSCGNNNLPRGPIWIGPSDSIAIDGQTDDFYGSVAFSASRDDTPGIYYVGYRRDSIYKVNLSGISIAVAQVPKSLQSENFIYSVQNDTPVFISMENWRIMRNDSVLTKLSVEYSKSTYLFYMGNFDFWANSIVMAKQPYLPPMMGEGRKIVHDTTILCNLVFLSNGRSSEELFLHYPIEYRGEKYYSDDAPVFARATDSTVFYLFNCADSLGSYNLRTRKTKLLKIEGYKHCEMRPQNPDSVQFLSYCNRQSLQAEQLVRLLHDSRSGKFVAVKVLPLMAAKEGSELFTPTYRDKESEFIIIDTTKVLKTFKVTNYKAVWPTNSFVWSNKLYIWNYAHTKIYVYEM